MFNNIFNRLFSLINIQKIADKTDGNPAISIAVIDGPVNRSHPDLVSAKIKKIGGVSGSTSCVSNESTMCKHGTFVAGMLCCKRMGQISGLCPGSTFLHYQIFCEEVVDGQTCPEITPASLAEAVTISIQSGAKIINLSLGLASSAILEHPDLNEAFDYAFRNGVLVVGASGNQGRIGHMPLFRHPWIIPVAASDTYGNLIMNSNTGISVGRYGLLAPGKNIPGLSAEGGYTSMTGTSVAAPFVTGALALLWSLYPEANAEQLRRAVLLPGKARKNIIPPLLNVEESRRYLERELNGIYTRGNQKKTASSIF
jgi:subtilisin family serine protease